MLNYNVIMVFNKEFDKILMCKRRKEPYRGLLNLVGGKIEDGEESLTSAYRELYEETNIPADAIRLHHLMDFTYCLDDILLECYVGKLKSDVIPSGDENELCWIGTNSNFFDCDVFAGKGNIGHMLEQVKTHRSIL